MFKKGRGWGSDGDGWVGEKGEAVSLFGRYVYRFFSKIYAALCWLWLSLVWLVFIATPSSPPTGSLDGFSESMSRFEISTPRV